MKYLVTAEYIDPGPLLQPQQVVEIVEGIVGPSLETLAELEDDGRLTGGLYAGQRAGAFVVEADSNDEVSELIANLPFWGLCSWEVTPLEDWSHRLQSDRARIEAIKATLG